MPQKKSIKYFIGYNDDGFIRPLCKKLSQMICYVKHFDSSKTMSFKVINSKLLKNYTRIREKVSNLMNMELGSEPAYGDNGKYIKTKISKCGDKINRNFQGKKNTKRRCIIHVFVFDNVRFCY